MTVGGVRVTLLPTASSRPERSPDPREAAVFLELADLVLDRFRPQVLLTYGGHPAGFEMTRRARLRGTPVVFHLHNFGYNDRRAFAIATKPPVENRKPDLTPAKPRSDPASPTRRGPPLPGSIQELSRGPGRILSDALPVRRSECLACEPGATCRAVALGWTVAPGALRKRR